MNYGLTDMTGLCEGSLSDSSSSNKAYKSKTTHINLYFIVLTFYNHSHTVLCFFYLYSDSTFKHAVTVMDGFFLLFFNFCYQWLTFERWTIRLADFLALEYP